MAGCLYMKYTQEVTYELTTISTPPQCYECAYVCFMSSLSFLHPSVIVLHFIFLFEWSWEDQGFPCLCKMGIQTGPIWHQFDLISVASVIFSLYKVNHRHMKTLLTGTGWETDDQWIPASNAMVWRQWSAGMKLAEIGVQICSCSSAPIVLISKCRRQWILLTHVLAMLTHLVTINIQILFPPAVPRLFCVLTSSFQWHHAETSVLDYFATSY